MSQIPPIAPMAVLTRVPPAVPRPSGARVSTFRLNRKRRNRLASRWLLPPLELLPAGCVNQRWILGASCRRRAAIMQRKGLPRPPQPAGNHLVLLLPHPSSARAMARLPGSPIQITLLPLLCRTTAVGNWRNVQRLSRAWHRLKSSSRRILSMLRRPPVLPAQNL